MTSYRSQSRALATVYGSLYNTGSIPSDIRLSGVKSSLANRLDWERQRKEGVQTDLARGALDLLRQERLTELDAAVLNVDAFMAELDEWSRAKPDERWFYKAHNVNEPGAPAVWKGTWS